MKKLPFKMFDQEIDSGAARKLESIYHKGQEKIWDGRKVLQDLIDQYNGIDLAEEQARAIHNIFAVIFWGEFAAWKISAELAAEIDQLEPKMAATAQAHDEARHFYVMRDYLNQLGFQSSNLTPAVSEVLTRVLNSNNLAKKLLGMQLMVEPVALTIFKFVRESQVEPVLCDLLAYYEMDESRHVALGIQYLPTIIDGLSYSEKISLLIWQMKILTLEIDGLRELENDFRVLGFEPKDVFLLAEKKQLEALELLSEEMGLDRKIWEPVRKVMNLQKDLAFSDQELKRRLYAVISAFRSLLFGV